MGKGPCEHMIALFKASAEERRDLPTSTPAAESGVASSTNPREDQKENEDLDEGRKEDFDENELDEKSEGR